LAGNYPQKNNLREQIDKAGLYPVTCLTTITADEKAQLLKLDVVLCRQIRMNQSFLQRIGIGSDRVPNILAESNAICNQGLM
jgi:hypothetical protein